MSLHKSVLVKEVLQYLGVQPNKNIIDGTFGQGGHSELILKNNKPQGKVLAIDADQKSYQLGKALSEKYNNRLLMFNGNFCQVDKFIQETEIKKWDGVLLDLGWSMDQIKRSGRGFSFNKEEELDMRYSVEQNLSAKEVVNTYSEKELADIFYYYGEERQARRIARFIVEAREKEEITTTEQLAEILKKSIPKRFWPNRLHPATLVFQALRIEVNKELHVLEEFLEKILKFINEQGRVVIISFHSLED